MTLHLAGGSAARRSRSNSACTVQWDKPNRIAHRAHGSIGHDDAWRVHRQVAGVGVEGALGVAVAFHSPVPFARRADADGRRPVRRVVLLRARRTEGHRRRRLGRCVEARLLRMEYKGRRADLDAAFNQLRQYALALENPPLLIVSDMARFRIRTNWTNSVSVTHEFTLDDLADGATRDRLKWAMSEPERLRPGETRQAVTERAAATFAELAQGLRDRGHDPQTVAHFVNRMVFCMFAEDAGLLPGNMFTRMLEHARRRPEEFGELARDLFGAMSTGGRIGFEAVAWFNGGLFDDDTALPLDRDGIETALKAAALDWSEIDPSILGTLFERGLDPDKRSQLGAHYTDLDKIMRIVEPVIVRPLLAEWERAKTGIAAMVERADAAGSPAARTRRARLRALSS